MLLLLSSETAGKAAEHIEQAPIVVRLVNQYFGQAAYNLDRKSTRLNSSHSQISYAVFCLKKKKQAFTRPHYDIRICTVLSALRLPRLENSLSVHSFGSTARVLDSPARATCISNPVDCCLL